MAALRTALAAGVLCMAGAALAGVLTYTHLDTACEGCRALGYPVPVPVDSLDPVEGFRSYATLIAGLQARATGSARLLEQEIGRSLRGRPIIAFVIGDADAVTAEGLVREGAMLVNGGIHAREWASPEVVAGLLERLDDSADDGGFHQYLVENFTTVVIPVLNPDGFLQTQRYPDQALESEFAGDPTDRDPDYPRDGRMRRKNMRDTDELLDVGGDGMNGVDLNRNNPPFWANSSGTRSSPDPRSLVHHGTGPASEPETRALQDALALLPDGSLRLYFDVHSFSRVYFAPYTGNPVQDANLDRLGAVIDDATPLRYRYLPSGPGGEIGSTDEYFAYTYAVPSFTLEIEPASGGTEYGGFGVSHDGFILPASQIARVRAELADALLIAAYRQAGPPVLLGAELRDADGTLRFSAARAPVSASRRQTVVGVREPLQAGAGYELLLQFSKPMRVRDGAGQVVNYRGQDVALAPAVALVALAADGSRRRIAVDTSAGEWVGTGDGRRRYADDAFRVALTLPADLDPAAVQRLWLEVQVQDAAGLGLDALPETVADWADGGWVSLEGEVCASQTGGTDAGIRLVDDGAPLDDPCAGTQPPPAQRGGGGGALAPWWLALAMLRRRKRKRGAAGAPQGPRADGRSLALPPSFRR